MQTYQGHLLVASPYLPDPNFYRSVVLLLQHDEDGAVGLILNRPTDITVEELWNLPGELISTCERTIHSGGPVSDQLMMVHGNKSLSESDVLPGVYVTTQPELLEEILQSEDFPALLFTGYSGWASGQLENEMEMGGWLTKPATFDEVFGEHEDLWKAVVQEIGFEIIAPSINRQNIPADPSLN